jgi:signal peptidase II
MDLDIRYQIPDTRYQIPDIMGERANHLSRFQKIGRFFLLATLLSLPIDQWTKSYARDHYLIHEDPTESTIYQGRRTEVGSAKFGDAWATLNLTYVRNHGASWGQFRDLNEDIRRPALIAIGLVLAAFLLCASNRLERSGLTTMALALTAILAGAVGNFIDRVRLGYVVDLLAFKCGFGSQTWGLPAFNVADVVIVGSLFCLITMITFNSNQKKLEVKP